ncbi:hypothetical protein BJ165DRAFT_1407286 [Panaeolus papilionaceus]|nr:hypothetical protein BJ165DRAFT_1407286 [Panaeolus papilionaceus]
MYIYETARLTILGLFAVMPLMAANTSILSLLYNSSTAPSKGEFKITKHNTLIIPPRDVHGKRQMSREEYSNTLLKIRRREPLREACARVDINPTLPKSATLERLRYALVDYWYVPDPAVLPQSDVPHPSALVDNNTLSPLLVPELDTTPNSEEALVVEFGVQGAAAEEVLGYDEEEELDEVEFEVGGGLGPHSSESHDDYRTRIRLEETRIAEQSRCASGIKTQNAMVKAWKEFCTHALECGQIRDEIIYGYHILLYIRFCSERPKRDRKGNDIPGTFIGASHIKKLYFGALRIRKEQEAKDPELSGLVPEEDAPDIVANTFLAAITDEQLAKVGEGFLKHREHQQIGIFSVLGCQGEEKAGASRGMCTIRILLGKKSLSTPYHEQSLYNIYVKAFAEANFVSRLKSPSSTSCPWILPRADGVDASITSRMGWAIFGTHAYKVHELYDPVWRHVHVPEQSLHLVCPMAEANHHAVVGRENLSGAANHWSRIMQLRPYPFQCGAAIYQKNPDSALFRLPALANADVRNWMKHGFPNALSLAKASAGSPIEMERRQEYHRGQALLERRTDVLTPPRGFNTLDFSTSSIRALKLAPPSLPSTSTDRHPTTPTWLTIPLRSPEADQLEPAINGDNTGVYQVTDNSGETGLRAFANSSPKTRTLHQQKSQVDLILPPAAAFSFDNQSVFWPPLLRHGLQDQWTCWSSGKAVFNAEGVQRGVKPPLRDVEGHFTSKNMKVVGWRSGISGTGRKAWEQFREIPEYIDSEAKSRGVSPLAVLEELEGLMSAAYKRLSGSSRGRKWKRTSSVSYKPRATKESC